MGTKIVADTLSGYFLMEKRLVCHILPNAKVHALMFAKPKRVPSKADGQKKARGDVNKHRSADVLKGITTKLVQREEMKRKKFATLGIDYEFPGYAEVSASASKPDNTSLKTKKRKTSYGEEEDDKNNVKEVKTLKSQNKKRAAPKKSNSLVQNLEKKESDATTDDKNQPKARVEEKENDAATDDMEKKPKESTSFGKSVGKRNNVLNDDVTPVVTVSSKKKKKSKTKTPKKAKTPKNK